MEDCFI